MSKLRLMMAMPLACISCIVIVGCSQNAPTVYSSSATSAGSSAPFNPNGGQTAEQIQSRIDAVKANTQATDEEKQMVIQEMQHAQATAPKGPAPSGQ